MDKIKITTIGFTKTNAEHFFRRIKHAKPRKVVDVRLHNTSQLAGFAKSDDLAYFLSEICGVNYVHEPRLAPTDEMLKPYRREEIKWPEYSQRFLALMSVRKIETEISPESLDQSCLLCSEPEPHHCHRRLVCEYLNEKWGGRLDIAHL